MRRWLVWRCPRCEVRRGAELDGAGAPPCASCGLDLPRGPLRSGEPCPVCGSAAYYRHRDFNRYLGIALVVGAGLLDLALETLPLCLALMSALDLVLFRWLPEVVVCYGCEAILRGVPPGEGVGAFDLEVAERERLASGRRLWERLQAEPPPGSPASH